MIFDDNSVPFSKLSLNVSSLICPCKKPAANKSPAPVKSRIFRFFLLWHSIIPSLVTATLPLAPRVITNSFFKIAMVFVYVVHKFIT